jgi:hypothetical protein
VAGEGDLLGIELSYAVERIDLVDGLVRAETEDSRKTKRVAPIVALRPLNSVEGYFDHYFGLDHSAKSAVFSGVLQEIVGVLANLRIRQAGVCLADRGGR